MLIEIVDDIDIKEICDFLQSPDTGAVNLFIGTVRNHTKGKQVVKLVFEAYDKMALKEMCRLATKAKEKWPVDKLLMLHITGEKKPGEAVVAIGVTSAHRDASFEACRFLIDELKKTVPIWKKEFYTDNSVWVNAHP
ncbi:MAG: molybdenum cofactor biosynthesis protein MoaE [Bacteroidota bacterium]|nr:molybdenum cofactor biosynthesis protein MoaE [Bacteroidota bacterium]